jgi:YebC/PmpR family DNA-binding regulatory protein
MSGHSKWATIKRKKAAADAARGKLFTKAIKEITLAARHGGGDPASNARLRTAITAAKAINMPAANIDRAVKRGTGELEGVSYEETVYEGYGPGGVAILVEVATDNRNRTTGEIRHLFTKNGGNLAEAGAVSYLFKPSGVIQVDRKAVAEETLIEAALEAGAEDVHAEADDCYEVITLPGRLEAVREALQSRRIPVQSAEQSRVPTLQVPVQPRDAETLLKLIDLLEDHDDVQKVWSNFAIPDEVLAKLAR